MKILAIIIANSVFILAFIIAVHQAILTASNRLEYITTWSSYITVSMTYALVIMAFAGIYVFALIFINVSINDKFNGE